MERLNTSDKINSYIGKIMILAEDYPDLKANENFLKLSHELTNIENDIANSRKYYNGCVREFNNKVEMFPNSILAKLFGYTSKKWFEAKDKEIWWQMIQLLPSSYNQKRTIMFNYEVLANIYKSRKNHKLDEWREHDESAGKGFCDWIKELPYSELIIGEKA